MAIALEKLPEGLKHSFWSVLDAALYPVAYMATVPVFLHYMHQELFGFWMIINSIITILQLFNFNLGLTVLRNVSYELAHDRKECARDLINGTLHITFILLLVSGGIGYMLSQEAVQHNWWGLGSVPAANASLCLLLAAVLAGMKYFDQALQSIIKAREQFRLAALLNIFYRFGLLLINLAIVIIRCDIALMLWGNIVFSFFYLLLQYLLIWRIMPFYRPGRLKDVKQYHRLLGFSLWPWLQSLIIVLTFQTDRFWVSSFAGLKEVSAYALVSTMFNHIHIIFTAMAAWILPRVSAMTSRGDDPSQLYRQVRAALLSMVFLSLLLFYFIAPPLFRLWVGNDTYIDMAVYIRSFIAFEIVFAHTILPFMYLNAAGRERSATWLTLFYCGLCYILMLAGLQWYHSPAGLVDGMTLSMCLSMPLVNMAVQRAMHKSPNLERSLWEMLPMYAALLYLYHSHTWLYSLSIPLALWLLWKFYLSDIANRRSWKQLSGI